ncbi:glycoside hydrolase family 16 protein [Moniliophthora roreri MCA 2997]|uniref:Glycoside hydrolase family 16 protein n=1 Tax=Moniliophthora roreri (strain MCA 2997) TaxID=1381753 RepID=V2XH74_MONRO|nr:glycoside hydrolase family 16 protein [Moniliophthora roreri MCA 2997]
MKWRSRTTQLSLVFLQIWAVLGQYEPIREYSGQDFFSKWDFISGVDSGTKGNVQYVDQGVAAQQKLAFVDSSSGHAFVRVDNTTKIEAGPFVHRNSIISKDAYPVGSLIIIDALHIPYGCSVWPAFWTIGTELGWPHAGEIDIIEGINGITSNNVVMHTDPGCTQSSNVSQGGKTTDADCGTDVGCKVEETKLNSYGPGFAQAGGGVFAAQIDNSGVFVWFWSRPDIPASISNAKSDSAMDMSDWGQPSAAYPNDACDIAKFFKPQKLVLDITLCGEWAGIPAVYSATCPGECIANVIGDGSNYGTAYWEISYIRTFATKASNIETVHGTSEALPSPSISTRTTLESTTGVSRGESDPGLPPPTVKTFIPTRAATFPLFNPPTPSTTPTPITTTSSSSTAASSPSSLGSFNLGGINATGDNPVVVTTTSAATISSLSLFNPGGVNATSNPPATLSIINPQIPSTTPTSITTTSSSSAAANSPSSLGSFNLGGINATSDGPVAVTTATTTSPSSLASFNLGGINATSNPLVSSPTDRDTAITSPQEASSSVESQTETEPTSSSSALQLSLDTTLFLTTIPSLLVIITAFC